MAIFRELVLPLANYQNGIRQVPERSLPDSASELYFEFARCTSATPSIWPNETTRLQMDFEGSTDGITWFPAGGFSSIGGIITRFNGVEVPLTTIRLPLPKLAGRLIRATIQITGGPLRTEGSIELRD